MSQQSRSKQTSWQTCGFSLLSWWGFFCYFYLFTQAVWISKCLLQHITSFCCLLGLVTSVLTMSLAGHGCQLQAYDRVPSALFMEMSHWGKMAYSFRPMYGGMNNGWRSETQLSLQIKDLLWCVPLKLEPSHPLWLEVKKKAEQSFWINILFGE